jgi:poly-beta-1,6 N-acetyl-D-glucosamine synthase
MQERAYPAAYVLGLATLLAMSWLLFDITSNYPITIPLDFDTVYETIRSIVSIAFFAFFMLLMFRQAVLVFSTLGDEVDRYVAEARARSRGDKPFTPFVSIIVPAYNEAQVIQSSIRALLKLEYPRYEVIVVDDGSSDETLAQARVLEGQHGNARVTVLWKPNGGKASALNFGIARSAADFVATMDSDSHLQPQTLEAAMQYFKDPYVGAVAGNVRVGNLVNLWTRLQALEYLRGLNLVRRAQSVIRTTIVVPGPIGIFRKSVLAEVGYYDSDTFAEDCDLTLKIVLAGWKICYEPKAISLTEAPEDLPALMKQRYRWTRGMLQSLRKHKKRLLFPKGSLTGTFTLWYLLFEVLMWPLMNASALIFLAFSSVDTALQPAAAYYWLQILLLEIVSAWYSVGIEERDLRLALYTPLERLIYQILMDICRILATLEEFVGFKMSWGKLERKGRL